MKPCDKRRMVPYPVAEADRELTRVYRYPCICESCECLASMIPPWLPLAKRFVKCLQRRGVRTGTIHILTVPGRKSGKMHLPRAVRELLDCGRSTPGSTTCSATFRAGRILEDACDGDNRWRGNPSARVSS